MKETTVSQHNEAPERIEFCGGWFAEETATPGICRIHSPDGTPTPGILCTEDALSIAAAMQSAAPSAQVVEALKEVEDTAKRVVRSFKEDKQNPDFKGYHNAQKCGVHCAEAIVKALAAARQPASVPVPVGRSEKQDDALAWLKRRSFNSTDAGTIILEYIAQLEARPAVQPSKSTERYLFEAQAALDAVYGQKRTPGTFYYENWHDKPHRVVGVLVKLLRECAQQKAPQPTHMLDEELSAALNLAEMYQSGAFGEEKERSLLAKALLHVWALYDVQPSQSADYCNIAVLLAETARNLRDKPYEDVAEAFEKVLVRAFADAQHPAPVVAQSDENVARAISRLIPDSDQLDYDERDIAALIAAHRKADGETLRDKLNLIEGGLECLRMAVAAEESRTDTTFRINDLLKDVQRLSASLSQTAKGEL